MATPSKPKKPVAKPKLTDPEAKALLAQWPASSGDVVKTDVWPTPHGRGAWLRAQPPDPSSGAGPTLTSPGATLFTTQPDGLWVWLGPEASFADLLAIEVCGTAQNLNDKRSRYGPTTSSLLLKIPSKWLHAHVPRRGGSTDSRLTLAGLDTAAVSNDLLLPVRWTQVLYALPNDVYRKWTAEQVPGPHEYFCRHGSLGSYTSQKMQAFLSRMTLRSHFLTEPGK